MVSPRERPRSNRRRIAGERTRPPGSTAPSPTPGDAPTDEAPDAPGQARPGSVATEAAPALTEDGPAATEAAPTATEDEGAAAEDAPVAARAERDERAESAKSAKPAKAPRLPRGAKPAMPAGGPPNWVLAVLAGLLVAALALDGFVVWREVSQRQAQEEAARGLHSAVIQAPPAAERAAEALLSYRHDTLDKDLAEARRFLTDRYEPQYSRSIEDLVAGPAADVKAVVKADVLSSGVVEASGNRSDVLLFVNQTTSAPAKEPQTALNRVVFTMVPRDGGWLVNEIQAF